MGLSRPTRTGLLARSHAALPAWPVALGGALAWAVVMGASAALGLWLRAWETQDRIVAVVALFAAGGAIAFVPGLFLARLAAGQKPRGAAFAAVFLGLSIATIGFTAALYALCLLYTSTICAGAPSPPTGRRRRRAPARR